MQLKKGMEFELQTFDLEDVERLLEPIFEACLSYVNSNLKNKKFLFWFFFSRLVKKT